MSYRGWGIVSTVYLVTAPVLLFLGYGILGSSRQLILHIVALLGPLPLGFILASLIESGRDPEPKLQLFDDHVLRGGRIVLGFLVPLLLAWLFAFLAGIGG